MQKRIYDAKEPRRVKLSKLEKILSKESEKIYPYHPRALKYYVEQREKGLV